MNSNNFTRRHFMKTVGLGAAALTMPNLLQCNRSGETGKLPNVVIIFTDDQGYADVGCYGAQGFRTPHLDRMAEEGVRFTDFYVGAPKCTPSRASLMTGCYPQRVGLPHVLGPNSEIGLNSEELTIAELLKSKGYATACFGKWHLGDSPEFLPLRHGFDQYFGLPYSNDMWPKHPTHPHVYPPLPLIEGDEVIEHNPDQTQLTIWYTERSVKFIEENKDGPFFLYLAHSMPHVPLFVSDKFQGKSKQGLYGDVIMEIDWSVGQILDTLKRLGIDENTLVMFSSDNGPWLSYGNHAGSAGALREGKHTTFDGGQREPCIMRWPGQIPANEVCHELATVMDILPTIATLTDTKLPDRKIDGKNIWPLMSAKAEAKSPHETFFFYNSWDLQAVRSGKWKLHLPHQYRSLAVPGKDGQPGQYEKKTIDTSLFNLKKDIGEQNDVASKHPEVVKRLKSLAGNMVKKLGDDQSKGTESRPPGRLEKLSQ